MDKTTFPTHLGPQLRASDGMCGSSGEEGNTVLCPGPFPGQVIISGPTSQLSCGSHGYLLLREAEGRGRLLLTGHPGQRAQNLALSRSGPGHATAARALAEPLSETST